LPDNLNHYLIRSVLALCRLAAASADDDARTDLSDDAFLLLDAVTAGAADRAALANARAGHALESLARLGAAGDATAVARARLWLMRLRAATTVSAPAPQQSRARPDKKVAETPAAEWSPNQEKVLEWLAANPGARPKELIGHFNGTIASRTLKRILAVLVSAGAVRKIEDGAATVYEVVARRE